MDIREILVKKYSHILDRTERIEKIEAELIELISRQLGITRKQYRAIREIEHHKLYSVPRGDDGVSIPVGRDLIDIIWSFNLDELRRLAKGEIIPPKK